MCDYIIYLLHNCGRLAALSRAKEESALSGQTPRKERVHSSLHRTWYFLQYVVICASIRGDFRLSDWLREVRCF